MSVVLRIYGKGLALDDVVTFIPADRLQRTWRAGELGRDGKPNATSGVEPRPGADLYLFYGLMHAIDLERADEAERVYCFMTPELRGRIDALEDKNPGQVKIWLRLGPP